MSYKLKGTNKRSTMPTKSFKDHDWWSCAEQLKERLGDVIEYNKKFNDEYYLIPWLKKYQFKLDRTETAIREAMNWRKANNIESLAHIDIHATFGELTEEFPLVYGAHSKKGQPVFTVNGDGVSDPDAILKKYGKDKILKYIHYAFFFCEQIMYEHIQDLRAKEIAYGESLNANNAGVGCIVISSCKNLSLWNAKSRDVISIVFETAKVGASYFPVFLETSFIVNMNPVHRMVFNLIKPILGSPFYEIKCYDQDKEKWLAAILEEVDIDELAVDFGGNKILLKK